MLHEIVYEVREREGMEEGRGFVRTIIGGFFSYVSNCCLSKISQKLIFGSIKINSVRYNFVSYYKEEFCLILCIITNNYIRKSISSIKTKKR